jgi:hypothetical protein
MIVEYYGKSGWLTAESVSESDFFDSDRFTSTRTSNSETPKRLKEEKGTQKGCKPFVWRADRTPGGSQTSPRRLKLPTSPHRLKLREATSGKPGGYVWLPQADRLTIRPCSVGGRQRRILARIGGQL